MPVKKGRKLLIDCQKGIAERKSIGVIGFKIFHKTAAKIAETVTLGLVAKARFSVSETVLSVSKAL